MWMSYSDLTHVTLLTDFSFDDVDYSAGMALRTPPLVCNLQWSPSRHMFSYQPFPYYITSVHSSTIGLENNFV